MNWTKSGSNWMAVTWVDDAQVIYKLVRHPLSQGAEYWAVHKLVSGVPNRDGYIVGTSDDLEKAKALAEDESEKPL